MLVRALRTHTQPGSGFYRNEGEKFDHPGKLYEHVEKVKAGEPDPEDEQTNPEGQE